MSNDEAVTFLTEVVMKLSENKNNEVEIKKKPKLHNSKVKSMTLNDYEIVGSNDRLSSKDMAEALIDVALATGSTDNLSSIIVKLKNP